MTRFKVSIVVEKTDADDPEFSEILVDVGACLIETDTEQDAREFAGKFVEALQVLARD